MESGRPAAGARTRGALLLGATLACIALMVVAGFLTRLSLLRASAWVAHSDQVKLALAACDVALARGDTTALRQAEDRVEKLAVDNPRQAESIARAKTITGSGSPDELEALFASMQAEEDRLRVDRLAEIDRSWALGRVAFFAATGLMLAFAVLAVRYQRAQGRALRRAHDEASEQRAMLQAVIETVDEGVVAVDAARNTLVMNAVARAMVGADYPRDHLPKDWRRNLRVTYEDGSTMRPEDGPLTRALRGEASEDVVCRMQAVLPGGDLPPGSTPVWVSTTARPLRDEAGRVAAAVATLRDITEQRANLEKLRDLSLTDELTGLFNRRGFFSAASARITIARREKTPMGLLYADLNGLKRINDELGHEHGDQAIKDAAAVLRGVIREGDVLARVGGDEFVALLPNFAPAARDPLLERLTAAIRAHVEQEKRPYRLSMSAGTTFMDWDAGQSLDDLVADADRRMYTRKRERAGMSIPVPPPRAPDAGSKNN